MIDEDLRRLAKDVTQDNLERFLGKLRRVRSVPTVEEIRQTLQEDTRRLSIDRVLRAHPALALFPKLLALGFRRVRAFEVERLPDLWKREISRLKKEIARLQTLRTGFTTLDRTAPNFAEALVEYRIKAGITGQDPEQVKLDEAWVREDPRKAIETELQWIDEHLDEYQDRITTLRARPFFFRKTLALTRYGRLHATTVGDECAHDFLDLVDRYEKKRFGVARVRFPGDGRFGQSSVEVDQVFRIDVVARGDQLPEGPHDAWRRLASGDEDVRLRWSLTLSPRGFGLRCDSVLRVDVDEPTEWGDVEMIGPTRFYELAWFG